MSEFTLVELIERTLNEASPVGFTETAEALKKSLCRDAYFLEREKHSLDEERQRIIKL